MSKTIQISSVEQFNATLKSSKAVVVDYWCAPCKQVAPIFEQFSASMSKPGVLTFVKVNTENLPDLASEYTITALPTFMVFKNGKQAEKIEGAAVPKLKKVIEDLGKFAQGPSSSCSGSTWSTSELPKGYNDITGEVDLKGLELLNADDEFGTVRTLVGDEKPSALDAKGKATEKQDWVESDTDEQLMMYIPFQATVKIHTLQLTSLPPTDSEDDEVPMRPKTLKLYINKPHILGFEEAEDTEATQTIELESSDWDSNGVANIVLRFVKFQRVTSLVLFVVDGDGDSEKVRLDRVRIIGEAGEKREMGKLEKVEDE